VETLDSVTPLVVVWKNLLQKYGSVNTDEIRGFEMYKDFKNETDFNYKRIHLTTAALIQRGFNVMDLVYYIGGTHIGEHRDLEKIRRDLTPSVGAVRPDLLERVIKIFRYGSPQKAKGYSS